MPTLTSVPTRPSYTPTSPLLDILKSPQARAVEYAVRRIRSPHAFVSLPLREGHADLAVMLTESATIGSSAQCTVRLPGVASVHARITREPEGDYVLEHLDPESDTWVDGVSISRAVLVPGAVLEVGPWSLTYHRDEVEEIYSTPTGPDAA